MNKDINKLLRPNIKLLKPYSSARSEYGGQAEVYLDANESPFDPGEGKKWNRYPDPLQRALKDRISIIKGVEAASIFLGNGSDEAIDLLIRAFCEPRIDRILIMSPSYGMYSTCANINDVGVDEVPLNKTFDIDLPEVISRFENSHKIIFLCSPNNPTGNYLNADSILKILEVFEGIVVLDEAYIDFAPDKSFLPELFKYPNLVILQTLSKAWGLAGLRLGVLLASPEIVAILTKIKAPYNINTETQSLVLQALDKPLRKEERVRIICKERDYLSDMLSSFSVIKRAFPSDANFLLIQVEDAKGLYNELLQRGIVTRLRRIGGEYKDCLRITVGSPEENQILCTVLSEISGEGELYDKATSINVETKENREVFVSRNTKETRISLSLSLDGDGKSQVETGIAFFDHMLQQFAFNASVNLSLKAKGDLKVEEHHTIEDVGIALGEAVDRVLLDRKGIERYGYVLPMDDSITLLAIDLGGRSYLKWNVDFQRESLGQMPTEMFKHFFQAFANAARCTLHIKTEGENDHHKAESIFKAFGRAFKAAINKDKRGILPSTKGLI